MAVLAINGLLSIIEGDSSSGKTMGRDLLQNNRRKFLFSVGLFPFCSALTAVSGFSTVLLLLFVRHWQLFSVSPRYFFASLFGTDGSFRLLHGTPGRFGSALTAVSDFSTVLLPF